MHRLWAVSLAGFVCSLLALGATAAEPIRLVFPFPPGASADAMARLVADHMHHELGRRVVVENKTGAGGRIGVQAVKIAPPDGNTLLLAPIALMAIYPHVYPSLGYDPFGDFAPVSQAVTFDMALAVGPQVPATSLADAAAWLRVNPSQGNYGTPAAGSLPHFFAVLFARAAGLQLVHVPYKGTAEAMPQLIGGHISMVFSSTSELVQSHKAGRLRVLATSGAARSRSLPEVPTFKEAGYPIQGTGWHAIFAPARTPPELLERLNRAVVAALQVPDVRERLLAFGFEPTGTSREALAEIARRDFEMWGPVVKASGFTPDQ